MIFVTGGAGFIGSNFIINWFKHFSEPVVNIDKLTYAGNEKNLESLSSSKSYIFSKTDITSEKNISELLSKYKPRALLNFAAESHVDRSISGPAEFINTNIIGTFNLLQCAKAYWQNLPPAEKEDFVFLHVSTDEVYGSLTQDDQPFTELTAYAPNSPYSASKASSDHLVRSYHHTYGLPTVTTNCSNNYGPLQFPEKLIPLVIHHCLNGNPLPIYGDGMNVRDWLYVTDHCEAIALALENGRAGETYNIGGWNEMKNIEVVDSICRSLDQYRPRKDGKSYLTQKTFVPDRLGHDRRYAIDATKIEKELGWKPKETFATGIHKTVQWYLENESWVQDVIKRNQK